MIFQGVDTSTAAAKVLSHGSNKKSSKSKDKYIGQASTCLLNIKSVFQIQVIFNLLVFYKNKVNGQLLKVKGQRSFWILNDFDHGHGFKCT